MASTKRIKFGGTFVSLLLVLSGWASTSERSSTLVRKTEPKPDVKAEAKEKP